MVNYFAITGQKRDVGKAHFIGNEFFLQFMDGIQLGGIKAKLGGDLERRGMSPVLVLRRRR